MFWQICLFKRQIQLFAIKSFPPGGGLQSAATCAMPSGANLGKETFEEHLAKTVIELSRDF